MDTTTMGHLSGKCGHEGQEREGLACLRWESPED